MDRASALDERPNQDGGGVQVGLADQLADAQGDADALRNDLGGGDLQRRERLDERPLGDLEVEAQRRRNSLIERHQMRLPEIRLVVRQVDRLNVSGHVRGPF